jgi:uncharacterized protein with PQ loop repeat
MDERCICEAVAKVLAGVAAIVTSLPIMPKDITPATKAAKTIFLFLPIFFNISILLYFTYISMSCYRDFTLSLEADSNSSILF